MKKVGTPQAVRAVMPLCGTQQLQNRNQNPRTCARHSHTPVLHSTPPYHDSPQNSKSAVFVRKNSRTVRKCVVWPCIRRSASRARARRAPCPCIPAAFTAVELAGKRIFWLKTSIYRPAKTRADVGGRMAMIPGFEMTSMILTSRQTCAVQFIAMFCNHNKGGGGDYNRS